MLPLSLLIFAVLASIAVNVAGIPANEEQLEKKSYAGYRLLRTIPIEDPKKAEALLLSLDGKHGVHFWQYPKLNQPTDILASPRLLPHVQNLLTELDLKHHTVIEDINDILKDENPGQPLEEDVEGRQLGGKPRLNFQSYFRYNDILAFCRFLAENSRTNPSNPQVTVETIGKSTEGREIVLMKITKGDGAARPAIWIDGGMHAREWISPATALFIANVLATDTAKNQKLLQEFDWYIVPVINVDGYEFTHTGDRFWRKTRSRTSSYLGCRGVDPNRNWGFHWGEAGTSKDPCSEIYKGPRAFSEPETQAVSNAILARASQIKMYLTFHSYSQLLLVPYGFGNQKPADYQQLYNLAMKGKTALEQTYGTRYKVGTAPDLLYSAAGGSDDWAKGAAGIKYSYTYELRDTGRYGFALPANQIQPVGEETFNSVRALALGLSETMKRQDGVSAPEVPAPVAMPSPTKPKLPTPPKRKPIKLPPLPGWPQRRPGVKAYDSTNLDYDSYDIDQVEPARVLN